MIANSLETKLPLALQEELLNDCLRSELALADVLAQKGLTYDSLRYEDYSETPLCQGEAEDLDNFERLPASIPAISFFAGAGGLDIGFEHAGFENIASIECNEVFCNTLMHNNPGKVVIGPPKFSGDIRQHDEITAFLESIMGSTLPFDGVFHGGPPCQPFSVASNQRFKKESANFKRQGFEDEEKGDLLFDFLWYVKRFRPLAFLIENVDGVKNFDATGRIDESLSELVALGYTILPPRVVNAAQYGVPQSRLRWIMIGTRSKRSINFPIPNTRKVNCDKVFSRSLEGVENHHTRKHTAESIVRYMKLPFGCRDKLGRVDRLNPNEPSKTVIAGGTKGGGRSHLHPFTPRTISVRECARLQTFPDSYVFTGATARQFTQVGNAVPPLLAYKIAIQMRKSL